MPSSAKNASEIEALQQLRDSLKGQVEALETLNWSQRQVNAFCDSYCDAKALLRHLQKPKADAPPPPDPYGLTR